MRFHAVIPYATVISGILLTLLAAIGLLEPGMANNEVPASVLKAGIALGLFNVVFGLFLVADGPKRPTGHRP